MVILLLNLPTLIVLRPLLEYGICTWSPYKSKNICKVESVQRRFTKRLNGQLVTATPGGLLGMLGLESLELRRLHQDLIYTYKAIFGLIDIDCSKFSTVSPYSSMLGHDYKPFIQ